MGSLAEGDIFLPASGQGLDLRVDVLDLCPCRFRGDFNVLIICTLRFLKFPQYSRHILASLHISSYLFMLGISWHRNVLQSSDVGLVTLDGDFGLRFEAAIQCNLNAFQYKNAVANSYL